MNLKEREKLIERAICITNVTVHKTYTHTYKHIYCYVNFASGKKQISLINSVIKIIIHEFIVCGKCAFVQTR